MYFSVFKIKDVGCSAPTEPRFYNFVLVKAKKPGQRGGKPGYLVAQGEREGSSEAGFKVLGPSPGSASSSRPHLSGHSGGWAQWGFKLYTQEAGT